MNCTSLTISKGLDNKFRATIVKNKQLKKGCLRECVEEAIEDWIKKNQESERYDYA